MWLLPLGLGLNFKKVPWVTILLSIFIIGVFAFNVGGRTRIESGMEKAVKDSNINPASKKLFAEYCVGRLSDSACEKYSEKLFAEEPEANTEQAENEEEVQEEDISTALGNLEIITAELKVVEEFMLELENPNVISSLGSFAGYKTAREKRKSFLKNIYDKEKLHSQISINPESVVMAQFRHAGFMHLFGNLLMFFVFGAYVEIRMGAGLFALTFFVGGLVGLLGHILFFSNEDTFIVGASANVSAIMGAFFVLFRKFRMKFSLMLFVFPIRSFYASVALMFPLMYILGEVSSAVEAGMSSGGGVAHTAHLLGMSCGILMGLIEKKHMPLDWPFLDEQEVIETHNLKNFKSPRGCVRAAEQLLMENPENGFARYYSLKAIYTGEKDEADKASFDEFVREHLDDFVAVYYRRERWGELAEIVELIPVEDRLDGLLVDSGQSTLLSVADKFVERGQFFLALRFYDVFMIKYPRSATKDQVLDTCVRVFGSMDLTEENQKLFARYALKTKTELREIIENRIDLKIAS